MLYKAVGKVQTLASRAVSLALAQLSLRARFLGKNRGHHPGLCSVCAGLQGKATALGGSPVQHSRLQKRYVRAHTALLLEIRTVLYSGQHSTVKGYNRTTPAATAARTSGSCPYRQLAGLSPTKLDSILLLHTTQRKKITQLKYKHD